MKDAKKKDGPCASRETALRAREQVREVNGSGS